MKRILFALFAGVILISACKKSGDDSCVKASFTVTVDANGLAIFSDASSSTASSWLWDFGDGSTSIAKSPTHQYAAIGNYTVSLTVTGATVSCTATSSKAASVTSVSATVEKKNRAFLMDCSETWCPPCGTYGGPAFDSILHLEITKISAMKIYASSTPSSLNSSLSNSIDADFNVTGVPTFFMNGQEENTGGGVYSSISSNYSWANNITNTFASAPVVAAVGFLKSVTGNTMTIKAKVQFYTAQAAGKNFKLAFYVVEDQIIAPQHTTSGTVNNYEHRNLLRAGNNASYKGDALNSSAAITANQEFSKTYNITLDGTWEKANLKVIGVIWDATASGKPTFVNSTMAK